MCIQKDCVSVGTHPPRPCAVTVSCYVLSYVLRGAKTAAINMPTKVSVMGPRQTYQLIIAWAYQLDDLAEDVSPALCMPYPS